MMLLRLSAPYFITVQAPVSLTALVQALGTGPLATSAMVDRLISTAPVLQTSNACKRWSMV
jgi:hypothetical protein